MPVINAAGKRVDTDATGFSSSATFTAVAAALGAGDVMAGAQEFASVGPAEGGLVTIRSTVLYVAHTALIASEGAYSLHLYNVTPPSALADNAAWDLPAGDRASYLGTLALGTPVDVGSTIRVEVGSLAKTIYVPVGGSVYGYLVSAAAFTPTAVDRVVQLHAERV